MRFPYLYKLLNRPDVIAATGKIELPLFYISDVPQSPVGLYIVWSVPSGVNPYQYLSCPSDTDRYGVQIDVYGKDVNQVNTVLGLIRKHLHIHADEEFISYDYERETGLNRAILDVSLFVNNSWE